MHRFACLLALALLPACRGTRPSTLTREGGALLLVKQARIPSTEPWYTRFASHAWFDLRAPGDEEWTRVEVLSPHSGVRIDTLPSEAAFADKRWGDRRVRVRGMLRGVDAERAIAAILAQAEAYDDECYGAIPGPNSNTFVAQLIAGTPALRTTMDHNAVGKDYLTPVGVARTPSKTGGRIDTPYIGGAIALQEGVELHLVGLQFGIGLWPPRLCIPFLPEIGPAVPANGR